MQHSVNRSVGRIGGVSKHVNTMPVLTDDGWFIDPTAPDNDFHFISKRYTTTSEIQLDNLLQLQPPVSLRSPSPLALNKKISSLTALSVPRNKSHEVKNRSISVKVNNLSSRLPPNQNSDSTDEESLDELLEKYNQGDSSKSIHAPKESEPFRKIELAPWREPPGILPQWVTPSLSQKRTVKSSGPVSESLWFKKGNELENMDSRKIPPTSMKERDKNNRFENDDDDDKSLDELLTKYNSKSMHASAKDTSRAKLETAPWKEKPGHVPSWVTSNQKRPKNFTRNRQQPQVILQCDSKRTGWSRCGTDPGIASGYR